MQVLNPNVGVVESMIFDFAIFPIPNESNKLMSEEEKAISEMLILNDKYNCHEVKMLVRFYSFQ